MIAHFHIHRYSLPFIRPIRMVGRTLTTRDGLLVELQTVDGRVAFGDVAPFPGLSDESLDSAAAQLRHACALLQGKVLQQDDLRQVDPLPEEKLHPSVRYGIESAVLDLAAQERGVAIAALFAGSPADEITLNALVDDEAEAAVCALKLVESGYKTLKIKVGRDNMAAEIQMVRDIQAAVGRQIKLRLDANRAWSLQQAICFGHGVSDLTIDYIEEPLVDAHAMATFHAETGIPIALDESLRILDSPARPGVVAVIIKPGIHGGFFESVQLIEKARALSIRPVISSAFLSAVGLRVAAQLAAAYAPDDVCGLATSRWLAQDFIASPVKIVKGHLDVNHLNDTVVVSPALLREVR
ncbi:o-succinylbenzoate synthase [candidate division KSB1 bacterium]|nr:o-succinylbenzoate synthase [candidate division KSB1 bacterium]